MKFLFFTLYFIASTTWAAPCGKEGSIEERIKNCNSAKGEFVLIVRNELGLEVYKDLKSGFLWGDRIGSDFNHYGSQKACPNDSLEGQLLKEVKWRLPSIREFEVAASHGMKDSLPHMFHTFWSSTPVKAKSRSRRKQDNAAQAFLWDGQEQKMDTGDLKDAASVRCIGDIK
jgi:hypothetical protein